MIAANGIEIYYEEFGSRDDPAVLLIMGFGAQMNAWPTTFCEALGRDGFRVVRYDNRDTGLSTKTAGPLPILTPNKDATALGDAFELEGVAPYGLLDMAIDAIGLLGRQAASN